MMCIYGVVCVLRLLGVCLCMSGFFVDYVVARDI